MSNLLNLYGYSSLNNIDSVNCDELTTSSLTTSFFNSTPASYFSNIRSNIQTQIDTLVSTTHQSIDNIVLHGDGNHNLTFTDDGLNPSISNAVITKYYGNASKESHIDFNTTFNFNKTNDLNNSIAKILEISNTKITSFTDISLNGNLIMAGYINTSSLSSPNIIYKGTQLQALLDIKASLINPTFSDNVFINKNLSVLGNIDCSGDLFIKSGKSFNLGNYSPSREWNAGKIIYSGEFDS